jgi:two-component system sensor histidine kinase BaeS
VPPAALEHVFDKFYRVASTTGRSRSGIGLGLAVVRGFVEAMGGRVTARASSLGGLAVDIELRPAAAAGAAPADEPGQEAVSA